MFRAPSSQKKRRRNPLETDQKGPCDPGPPSPPAGVDTETPGGQERALSSLAGAPLFLFLLLVLGLCILTPLPRSFLLPTCLPLFLPSLSSSLPLSSLLSSPSLPSASQSRPLLPSVPVSPSFSPCPPPSPSLSPLLNSLLLPVSPPSLPVSPPHPLSGRPACSPSLFLPLRHPFPHNSPRLPLLTPTLPFSLPSSLNPPPPPCPSPNSPSSRQAGRPACVILFV